MKYLVTRPFRSNVAHDRGDTVELDPNGRNVQKLIDQRFIQPVTDSDGAGAPQTAPAVEAVPEPVKAAEAPKRKRGRPPKAKAAEPDPVVTLQ